MAPICWARRFGFGMEAVALRFTMGEALEEEIVPAWEQLNCTPMLPSIGVVDISETSSTTTSSKMLVTSTLKGKTNPLPDEEKKVKELSIVLVPFDHTPSLRTLSALTGQLKQKENA